MTNLDTPHHTPPERTFLSALEVFAFYGWGKTKGYQLRELPGFPRPIAGKYRMDTLIAWEEDVLAGRKPGCWSEVPKERTDDEDGTSPTTTEGAAPSASSSSDLTTSDEPMDAESPADLPPRRRTRGRKNKAVA